LAARDRLGLPKRAEQLETALRDTGFAPAKFGPALEAFRNPSRSVVSLDDLKTSSAAIMLERYLGRDGEDHVVVIYLHPRPGAAHEAKVEAAVHAADPKARITGYSRLDRSLRASLEADLPRVGIVAALLVLFTLGLALRRPREIALAMAVVVAELAAVLVAARVFDIPLHAYDALVLPVLLGITVDEAMFLLYAARRGSIRESLRREGPAVVTTGLTTAAGFAGLMICDFDGLRHLGMVGALGSIIGLVMALIVVPAGLRVGLARVDEPPRVEEPGGT
jgi:multidrug efflux pump subunit AcrB